MTMAKHTFVAVSGNRKLGPIACTYASLDSCPETCALRGSGCYAEFHHARRHADNATLTRGQLATAVQRHFADKYGKLIRFHVTGDLDSVHGLASYCQLQAYAAVTRGNFAWLYTHRTKEVDLNMYYRFMTSDDTRHVRVIPSADSIADAGRIREQFPWRIALCAPSDKHTRDWYRQALFEHTGIRAFTCAAAVYDDVTCSSCGVCADVGRAAVMFPAHGSGMKRVNERLMAELKSLHSAKQ